MIAGLSRDELAATVAAARASLIATLEELPVARWDEPSLCEGWTVRHVVGHLRHLFDLNRNPLRGAGVVRAGLRVNRYLGMEARRRAAGRTPSELLDALQGATFEQTIVWKIYPWPEYVLVELVVHAQDIRRPLGVGVTPDPSHLRIAADVLARPVRRTDPFRARLPAVRFEATDEHWSTGVGPHVRGRLEAIVMTLAGRKDALEELTGDGVGPLERR